MKSLFVWKGRSSESAPVVNSLQETPQRRKAMDFQSSSWNMRDFPSRNNSLQNTFAALLELPHRETEQRNSFPYQQPQVYQQPVFLNLTPETPNDSLPVPRTPRKTGNFKLDRSKLQPKKLSYTEYFGGSSSNKSVRVFHENSNHQNGTPSRTFAGEQARSTKDFSSAVPRGTSGQVHSSNKENDSPVSIPVRRNSEVKHNSVTRVDSSISRCKKSVLKPNVTESYESASDLRWDKVIEWLQPQRDVGTWIECCNKTCKKWRYVEEYHDPSKVPKNWFCWMQQTANKALASCDAPQTEINIANANELIENKYNAGSIVWAQIRGYPWWPGIVCDSPETLTFFKLHRNSIKPYQYFVVFFDQNLFEYGWIQTKNLKSFGGNKAPPKLAKKFEQTYADRLQESCKLAAKAENLTIVERLKQFDYLALYKKYNNIGKDESSSQESNAMDQLDEIDYDSIEIIPPTPQEVTTKRRRQFV